jgi:broad specificity phosphatase PhoE
MRIVLVPCAVKSWLESERLLGRVDLTPQAGAEPRLEEWVKRLQGQGVEKILHSPDELARLTAKLLAQRLGVQARAVDALTEVDVGLWTGLTGEQLRTRFSSCYRQLTEAPLSITPPEGESLASAAERIGEGVLRQVRRNGAAAVALVLRPLALSLARYALEPGDDSRIWEQAWTDEPVVIEVNAEPPVEPASDRAASRRGD